MLTVSKCLSGLGRITGDCTYNNTTCHTNLRFCRPATIVFIRKYSIYDKLELNDNGRVKMILDPKVQAVQQKIIYSDYLEKNKLKFGFEMNKVIERKFLKRTKEQKLHDLLNKPVYSVALKYLQKDEKPPVTEIKHEEEIKAPPKPIHMPYASTDKFKPVEIKEEPAAQNSLPVLNQQYQKLYEKYLAAKDEQEQSPKQKIKDLETRIFEMEMQRPYDKLTGIPPDWMTDYEQYDDSEEGSETSWESNYGMPNSNIPVSSTPCGGCGALLHCQDAAIPGYLPSELFIGLQNEDLRSTICQRCHFMKYYNTTLEVKVSPEAYPEILSSIKLKEVKAAVLLMIDLTDFPCSIWPNLPDVIGRKTPVFVVGNKVDLLPKDSPRMLENIEKALIKALGKCGLGKINIKHVNLISSKTGYGVERLINTLHKLWAYKGDVYMIGCTNVGKSTLFNALIQSDYCKIQAVDLIQRATTSPWPGTTLNLLKFPITNPVRWRLYMRTMRRKAERLEEHAEQEFRKRELAVKRDVTLATLQERIGRTATKVSPTNQAAYAIYETKKKCGKFGIDENDEEYKHGRWCYDTPGVIHPDQVLHLLTTEELLLTIPKQIISPRSFIFKPGQTLFLAGLGRLDFLNGSEFIRLTVFASKQLPITICQTADADNLYDELLKTEAFAVPTNDPERLKIWPALQGKEFSIRGIGEDESVADILLSSAGWIALTPEWEQQITVKAWTPEGRGIYLRIPALLSKSITHRGARIKNSSAYRYGRQVDTGHN